jgi:hypothetical protein
MEVAAMTHPVPVIVTDHNGMTLEFYFNAQNRAVFRVSSPASGNTIGLYPSDSDLRLLHAAIGAYLMP